MESLNGKIKSVCCRFSSLDAFLADFYSLLRVLCGETEHWAIIHRNSTTSRKVENVANDDWHYSSLLTLAQKLTESFGNIIAKKDAEIRELKVRVTALEEKTDDLEQYSKRNTIRIRGIP